MPALSGPLVIKSSISGPCDTLLVVQLDTELARLFFQLRRPVLGPLAYLVRAVFVDLVEVLLAEVAERTLVG